jgi:hypothetical protein
MFGRTGVIQSPNETLPTCPSGQIRRRYRMSVWGVAVATTAHTRNPLSRGLNRPFAQGNVPMRQLLAGPLRPDGDMLLLWSACRT